VQVAIKAEPNMKPAFVAFPGTIFSSKATTPCFMKGNTPLTAKLLKPALIDAETGVLMDSRDLPWYVSTLLISQPLHFGDYGGMPLKIIWAILDIITIVVLITGLYLWLRRRQAVLVLSGLLSMPQRRIIVRPIHHETGAAARRQTNGQILQSLRCWVC
jgi:uncharacterized iron-regulated membrane protein